MAFCSALSDSPAVDVARGELQPSTIDRFYILHPARGYTLRSPPFAHSMHRILAIVRRVRFSRFHSTSYQIIGCEPGCFRIPPGFAFRTNPEVLGVIGYEVMYPVRKREPPPICDRRFTRAFRLLLVNGGAHECVPERAVVVP